MWEGTKGEEAMKRENVRNEEREEEAKEREEYGRRKGWKKTKQE